MSSGASALGTLLVQRLDAVLGTTMAQHANLLTGARADAVARATQTARITRTQNATHTDVRHSVERVAQQTDPRAAVRDPHAPAIAGQTVPPTPSAPTQLGNVARLILTLLAQFPERSPSVVSHQPLWHAAPDSQQAPPSVTQLAHSLNQTLTTSGMFYESHLADLAFGQRSAEQLDKEPQAHLPHPAQTRAEQAVPLPQAEAAWLVRQQLEVLAYQMFNWQGEAWPGAPMDWAVCRHRDADHGEADADTDADTGTDDGATDTPDWSTQLSLELPHLGSVYARLSLTGQTLSIQLSAPDCADLLHTHEADLRAGYAAQGLSLRALAVDTRIDEP